MIGPESPVLQIATTNSNRGGRVTKCDPELLVGMAENLTWQAKEVQVLQTLFSLGVGLAVGLLISLVYSLVPPTYFLKGLFPPGSLVVGSTLVFGVIGFLRAREEARELRFRAHQSLCQLEMGKHLSKIARRPS